MLQLEVIDQAVEQRIGLVREGSDFRDLRMRGEALQPSHFDLNAKTDQAIFAENSAQAGCLAAVAAINRGYGGQGRELHRYSRQKVGRKNAR